MSLKGFIKCSRASRSREKQFFSFSPLHLDVLELGCFGIKPRHIKANALATWDREPHVIFLSGLGQAVVPLQCTGPRMLLEVAQLSKKIAVNKSVGYILLVTTFC